MGEEPSSDVFAARREKLQALRADGIEPFPHEFDGVEPIAAVRLRHGSLEPGEETSVSHRVAGRLAARRGQGKMAFLDLIDRSGRIQLQARVHELGDEGTRLGFGQRQAVVGWVEQQRRGVRGVQVVIEHAVQGGVARLRHWLPGGAAVAAKREPLAPVTVG